MFNIDDFVPRRLATAVIANNSDAVTNALEEYDGSVMPLLRYASYTVADRAFWALLPHLTAKEEAEVKTWQPLPLSPPTAKRWPLPRPHQDAPPSPHDLLSPACLWVSGIDSRKAPFIIHLVEEGFAPRSHHAFALLGRNEAIIPVLEAVRKKHGPKTLRSVVSSILPYLAPTPPIISLLADVIGEFAEAFILATLRTRDMLTIDALEERGARFGGRPVLYEGAHVASFFFGRGEEETGVRLMNILLRDASPPLPQRLLGGPLLHDKVVRLLDAAITGGNEDKGVGGLLDACENADVERFRLLLSLGYKADERCFSYLPLVSPSSHPITTKEQHLHLNDPPDMYTSFITPYHCEVMFKELMSVLPPPPHVWIYGASTGSDEVFANVRQRFPEGKDVLPKDAFPHSTFPMACLEFEPECAQYYIVSLRRWDAERGEMDWETLRHEAQRDGRHDILELLG